MLVLLNSLLYGQAYNLELVQDESDQYLFTIYAHPSTDATDAIFAQASFMILLERENTIGVFADILGSGWSVGGTVDADALSSGGIGDGTKDYYYITSDPSNVTFSHIIGERFGLVTFRVTSMPESGTIAILDNNDSIATILNTNGIVNGNIVQLDPNNGAGESDYYNGLTRTTLYVFEPLAITDFQISQFRIIPNPNEGQFEIELPQGISNGKIEIKDIRGREVVKSRDVNQVFKMFMDISKLEAGIYLIELKASEGVIRKRFVIK